jgi:hypothetical protein
MNGFVLSTSNEVELSQIPLENGLGSLSMKSLASQIPLENGLGLLSMKSLASQIPLENGFGLGTHLEHTNEKSA